MGMGPDSSKRLHSYRLTYFEVVMAKRRGRIVIRDGTGHWGGEDLYLGPRLFSNVGGGDP